MTFTVESTANLFAGHPGHLTPEQETAFEKFKQLCTEKGLYTFANDGSDGTPRRIASHDDGHMLRFLRARRFVVADAFTQFSEAEAWRQKEKIDENYEEFDVDEYERCRKLHPQWTGHRDKLGLPLYVYTIRHVTGPNYNEYTSAPFKRKMQRLATLYDNMTKFVIPFCNAGRHSLPPPSTPSTSEAPATAQPISSIMIITDISQVNLWTFWNLKTHMQETSKIASERYPETLLRQYIVGAPSFFPTVWGWIKKWFDPVTVAKITILPGNMKSEELGKVLGEVIDKKSLPRCYGGELDWEYGMRPALDEGLRRFVGEEVCQSWDEEEKDGQGGVKGPMWWVREVGEGNEEGGRVVRVGAVGGKKRGEVVITQEK